MHKKWSLGWKSYTSLREITSDGNMVTFVSELEDEPTMKDTLSRFRDVLIKNGLEIQEVKSSADYPDCLAARKENTIKIVFNETDWKSITVTCFDNDSAQMISKFFDDLYSASDVFPVFVAQIKHENASFTLKRTKLKGFLRTGVLRSETNDLSRFLYPETFLTFWLGREIVAKVLLGYHNGEMNESVASIVMLEVLEEYRNRGLGKKILKWVENLAQKQGFDRIWASDTTSMYFWQTNGYDIDIDEGLKYLDEI